MEKHYKKIPFGGGDSIEKVMQDLARFKDRGELVYGEFKGQKLYSDVDDVDTAYKKITGKTKAEFDALIRQQADEYEEEKRKHEEAITEMTKGWIEKGNTILDEKYHEKWAECVPIRLGDLYRGMELGCCLDIVRELNAGCTMDVAKKMIKSQGHSGMSHGLVCSMVRAFCDRGGDFVSYINRP